MGFFWLGLSAGIARAADLAAVLGEVAALHHLPDAVPRYGHNGRFAGFCAEAWYYPDKDTTAK